MLCIDQGGSILASELFEGSRQTELENILPRNFKRLSNPLALIILQIPKQVIRLVLECEISSQLVTWDLGH